MQRHLLAYAAYSGMLQSGNVSRNETGRRCCDNVERKRSATSNLVC